MKQQNMIAISLPYNHALILSLADAAKVLPILGAADCYGTVGYGSDKKYKRSKETLEIQVVTPEAFERDLADHVANALKEPQP